MHFILQVPLLGKLESEHCHQKARPQFDYSSVVIHSEARANPSCKFHDESDANQVGDKDQQISSTLEIHFLLNY